MKKELIAHKDPKSPVSEFFRTLRTNIQFMNTNNKLKTLLITSTLPGEGKSWVTSNLAVTFAQAGKRVILVDADMRKGRQYTIFEALPRPGLSNYLSGVDINTGKDTSKNIVNYIQETSIPNLYIIPAGNIPPNPSELLISTQMVDLLEKLKELCDIVIIDGTPCELVTDSIILSRIVDSTVIVTAHKQTKKDDLKKIVTNIQNVGGKISGIVLNKIPVSVKKYEQSYYYGSTAMTNVSKKPGNIRHNYVKDKSSIAKQNRMQEWEENVRTEKYKTTTNIREEQTQNKEENIDNLKPKININNTEEISLEKTTDILNKINAYLDEEKKNLNNK